MKILLLNQFFWPDSSATSQLLTDLARKMAADGHNVYAISAQGGYSNAASGEAPPVTMHYVKALPFVRGKIGRALSYFSFYLSAALRGLTLPRPDLVITLTTPPLLSVLGTMLKKIRGSRHFIWEMDLYPDVAVDLSYIRANGLLDRVTGLIADWSRLKADGIIALGECMKDRLMLRGVPETSIAVAHNWADGEQIRPVERISIRGNLVILYSGNLGLAHDVDTVAAAIRLLDSDGTFKFLFVGDGSGKQRLEAICRNESIVSAAFLPYADRAQLGESLGVCDIGLVTQRENCSGSVVPSKVYGLLAAGRPILFIGPAEATPARILREFHCGWHVENGDVLSVVRLLRALADDPEQVQKAGQNARKALLEHFDLPMGVSRICEIVGAERGDDHSLALVAASTSSADRAAVRHAELNY